MYVCVYVKYSTVLTFVLWYMHYSGADEIDGPIVIKPKVCICMYGIIKS